MDFDLEQFVYDNKDLELEQVISKLSTLETVDLDYEWNLLASNYSKLKYLENIVKNFYIPETDLFLTSLSRFMNKIDKTNIYYLENIELENEYRPIRDYIEGSLKSTDPIEKLTLVMKAYNILIPLVEQFRNENSIEDREFLKEFNFNKVKLN